MSIAIVGGTGDEGFGLALRLGLAGQEVVIGSRDEERGAAAAEKATAQAGVAIRGTDNRTAVSEADVVLVTVPYEGQAEIYRSIKEALPGGAIVCDTTTPLATAVGGRPWQVVRPWHGSAAEQARALLPKGARLVAGFHTIGAHSLQDLDKPVEGDALLCGDDQEAKAAVGTLVEKIPGMRWVDCGALSMARILEPITAVLIAVNRRYGIKDAQLRLTGRDDWGPPAR